MGRHPPPPTADPPPAWYTPEWAVELAQVAAARFYHAKAAARRWPLTHWVSAAWQRIHRLALAGRYPADATHARRLAALAGYRECLDVVRAEDKFRVAKRNGVRRFVQFSALPDFGTGLWREPASRRDADFAETVPAAEAVPDPDRRLLSLWCETRRERLEMGLSLLARLWLYLWLVEGLDQAGIAATAGVSRSAVSAAVGPAVRRFPRLARAVSAGRRRPAAG